MKKLVNLIILTSLIFVIACGANLSAKKKAPVEEVKSPKQLAIEASNEAVAAFDSELYSTSIEKFNEALNFYNEALATAAPEDSIPMHIYKTKLNIANVYVVDGQEQSKNKDTLDEALNSYDSAIKIYQEIEPESSPEDSISFILTGLYKNTAITSEDAEDYENAINYYNKYLEKNPSDSEILRKEYFIYKDKLGQKEQAFQVMKEYAEAKAEETGNKDNFEIFHLMGDLYNENKDTANAIMWWEKADSLKKDINLLSKLSNAYGNTKQYDKSNQVLEQIISMNPSPDELKTAYKVMGGNYKNLKNNAKAVEYFEKYVAMEYDEPIATYIASYYYDLKNTKKTIYWTNMVLDRNPANADALIMRAITKYNSKDNAGAKADFEKLKDDPKYGKAAQQYLQILK